MKPRDRPHDTDVAGFDDWEYDFGAAVRAPPSEPTREQCIEWVKYATDTTGYQHSEAVRNAILSHLRRTPLSWWKAKWENRPDLNGVRWNGKTHDPRISEQCPKCRRCSPECASPGSCHYDAALTRASSACPECPLGPGTPCNEQCMDSATRAEPLGAQMVEALEPHAKWLRQCANEIRAEGHAGWGNTCEWAAEAIDRTIARGK